MRSTTSVPEPVNGGDQAGDSTGQSPKVLPEKRAGSSACPVDNRISKQPKTQSVENCQHLGVLSLSKTTKEGCDPKEYVWWPCPLCAYEVAILAGITPPYPECNTTGPKSTTTASSPPPAPSQNADLAIVLAADVQTPAALIRCQENDENKVPHEEDGIFRPSDGTTQVDHPIAIGQGNAADDNGDTEQELARYDQRTSKPRDVDGQVKRNSSTSMVLFGTSSCRVPTSKSRRRKKFDLMNVEQQSSIDDQSPASCKAITPFNGGVQLVGVGNGPSSISGGMLQARNSHRPPIDQVRGRADHNRSAGGFPRRKPRRVRQLADLLAGNGNGGSENNSDNNHSSIKDSPADNPSHPTNLPHDQRRSTDDDDDLGRIKRPAEIDFLNVIHVSDSDRLEGNEEGGRPGVLADGRSNYSLLGKMDNPDQTRKNEQNRVGIQADDLDMVRPPSNNDHHQRKDGRSSSDRDDLMAIAEFTAKNQLERNNFQLAESDRHRNLISSTDHASPSSSKVVSKRTHHGGRMPFLQTEEEPIVSGSGSGRSRRRNPRLAAAAADDHAANEAVPTISQRHRRGSVFMNMGGGDKIRETPAPRFSSSSIQLDASSSLSQRQAVQVSSVVTPLKISDDMEIVRNNRILENSSELRDKVRAYMSSHTTSSKRPVVDFDLNVASPAPEEKMTTRALTELMIPFLNLKGKGTLDNSISYPNKSSVFPGMSTLPAPFINPGLSSSSSKPSFSLDHGKNLQLKGPYMPAYGNQLQLSNLNVNGKMNFFERSLFPNIGDHLRPGPPAAGQSSRHLTSADLRPNSRWLIPGNFSKPSPAFPVVNPFANFSSGNPDHGNGKRSIHAGVSQGVVIRPQPMRFDQSCNTDDPALFIINRNPAGILQGVVTSPQPTRTDRSRNADDPEFCTVNQNPADFTSPEPGNRYMIRGEDLLPRANRTDSKEKSI